MGWDSWDVFFWDVFSSMRAPQHSTILFHAPSITSLCVHSVLNFLSYFHAFFMRAPPHSMRCIYLIRACIPPYVHIFLHTCTSSQDQPVPSAELPNPPTTPRGGSPEMPFPPIGKPSDELEQGEPPSQPFVVQGAFVSPFVVQTAGVCASSMLRKMHLMIFFGE